MIVRNVATRLALALLIAFCKSASSSQPLGQSAFRRASFSFAFSICPVST